MPEGLRNGWGNIMPGRLSLRDGTEQAAVETARQQVEYTVVRAPYPGIVTRRSIEVGETVTVGWHAEDCRALDHA